MQDDDFIAPPPTASTLGYMTQLVYERPTYSPYYPSTMVSKAAGAVIGLIEFLLALRIVLELLGANASAPFVAWVYAVTGSLMGPFVGAFPNLMLGGFVLDIAAIFAMIGYAIIVWLVSWVLSLIF